MRAVEQADEAGIVERLDQRDVRQAVQRLDERRPHFGGRMDREYDGDVRPRRETLQRAGDLGHRAPSTLAAVRRHRDDAPAFEAFYDRIERCGERRYDAPIAFFRVRAREIAAAKSRLHMRHGDQPVVRRERGRHRRGGVALHHHPVRPLGVHRFADRLQQPCGQRVERLAGLHDVQVDIARDPGEAKHLIQELAMLAGRAQDRPKGAPFPERLYEREELDRFRTRADDDHELCRHALSPCASAY